MERRVSHASMMALAFLAAASVLHAQVELGGYYENTFQGDYTRELGEAIVNASKLRLDFSSGGHQNEVEFKGNINIVAYHGPLSFDVGPYLPDAVAASLGDSTTTIRFPKGRFYLDNAFLTWRKASCRLRAGKQQLSWGPGYSFNPTDLFHRKDMLDPSYEKEGVTALRFDHQWGVGNDIAVIAALNDNLVSSGYGLRIGSHIQAIGYDIALTLHQIEDSVSVDPATLSNQKQLRRALGLEFSGEFLGLGIWFEGNYNWMENEDDFPRAVVGLDYTLRSGLYLVMEGLLNGRGEANAPYPVEDWLANIAYGEPVGRSWVLAGIKYDLFELLSGSIYTFSAPDGGFMVNPRLNYCLAQNADLTVFGAVTLGKDDSQFPPGLFSLVARATVYF